MKESIHVSSEGLTEPAAGRQPRAGVGRTRAAREHGSQLAGQRPWAELGARGATAGNLNLRPRKAEAEGGAWHEMGTLRTWTARHQGGQRGHGVGRTEAPLRHGDRVRAWSRIYAACILQALGAKKLLQTNAESPVTHHDETQAGNPPRASQKTKPTASLTSRECQVGAPPGPDEGFPTVAFAENGTCAARTRRCEGRAGRVLGRRETGRGRPRPARRAGGRPNRQAELREGGTSEPGHKPEKNDPKRSIGR